MAIFIKENSDMLHEVIFQLSETSQEMRFPVRRIAEYLFEQGFIKNELESTDSSICLSKNGSKTLVTEISISFEKLGTLERRKYYQQFNTYIISSSKIFLQSALQNNKASIINLIQNQRRTCISNMYYAIHNGFAAMIEYYKSEYLSDEHVRNEIGNENEEETRLGHFTPHAFEVYLNNLDTIVSTSKENLEQLLINPQLGLNRMESYENPFTWIFPLFFEILNEEDFAYIINEMESALRKINLEKYGVEEGHRRSKFEIQLKGCITRLLIISNTEELNSLKRKCAILGGYVGFAYMLRQSADYDVLFDVKIQQEETISWAFLTSKFTKIVTRYIKEEILEGSTYEKLDAASSKEILLNDHNNSSLMTVIGIIQKADFSLVELIKKLYTISGYKIVDQRGRIPELSAQTESITICRILFGISLDCFICISKEGLFRIDISYNNQNSRRTDFTRYINFYYLEQLLDEEIIGNDLLLPNATIVRGLPTYAQPASVNYFDLVIGIHDMFRFRITRDIRQYLQKISLDRSSSELTVFGIMARRNIESEWSMLSGEVERYVRMRGETHPDFSNNKVLLIIFTAHNSNISLDQKQSLLGRMNRRSNNDKLFYDIEVVNLSEQELKQIVQKNYSKFDASIDAIVKDHFFKQEAVEQSNEKVTKITEESSIEFMETDDDITEVD